MDGMLHTAGDKHMAPLGGATSKSLDWSSAVSFVPSCTYRVVHWDGNEFEMCSGKVTCQYGLRINFLC